MEFSAYTWSLSIGSGHFKITDSDDRKETLVPANVFLKPEQVEPDDTIAFHNHPARGSLD